MIPLFESDTAALDASGRKTRIDDTITILAEWMEPARARLTEDDMTVLREIGAILYGAGLDRCMNRNP